MLPATVQFLIAMIAYAINERLGRRVEYLQEEVRVLRESIIALTGSSRIPFTADQRRRLAIKGKALTPAERTACCQVVRPATILAWFRELSARKYDSSRSGNRGGPKKSIDIVKLVVRLANENTGWGYTKIRDALRGLKIDVGRTTVGKILKDAGIEPAPERRKKRTWGSFIKSHWDSLYACDFFSVEVLGVTGTIRHIVFCVIELRSRSVEIAGIRISPDGEWLKQIARNLTDPVTGFLRNARYLIHDRGPRLHRRLDRHSAGRRRRGCAHPGAEPKLQSVRRTLRSDHQERMPRPLCHLRRASSPPPGPRVRHTLPGRAVSPRARRPNSSSAPRLRQ